MATAQYWKWCVFNLSMPLVVLAMAFMGKGIAYMTEEERQTLAETGRV